MATPVRPTTEGTEIPQPQTCATDSTLADFLPHQRLAIRTLLRVGGNTTKTTAVRMSTLPEPLPQRRFQILTGILLRETPMTEPLLLPPILEDTRLPHLTLRTRGLHTTAEVVHLRRRRLRGVTTIVPRTTTGTAASLGLSQIACLPETMTDGPFLAALCLPRPFLIRRLVMQRCPAVRFRTREISGSSAQLPAVSVPTAAPDQRDEWRIGLSSCCCSAVRRLERSWSSGR